MIDIIIVSFQSVIQYVSEPSHETNVTRISCTRRAVMGAKCRARTVGDETAANRHIGTGK